MKHLVYWGIGMLAGIMTPMYSLFAQTRSPDAVLPDAGSIPQGSGLFEGISLIEVVTWTIQWALGFVGIIIFIIFLFSGFEYATAGGDSSKAENATKRMVNAVIGMIIVFFAFVLSNAVLGFVFQVPPVTP